MIVYSVHRHGQSYPEKWVAFDEGRRKLLAERLADLEAAGVVRSVAIVDTELEEVRHGA